MTVKQNREVFYTVDEVSSLLRHKSNQAVRRAIKRGDIRAIKRPTDGHWLILAADVQMILQRGGVNVKR